MLQSKREGVLVIGAGGLGCPALLHLASSGVSTLGIADVDAVSLSNLPRQLLYTESDVGKRKVECALNALKRMPGSRSVKIHTYDLRVRGDEDFLEEYGVVIEAVDRADSKLAIHDAVVRRGIPFVHAGASGWEAQGLTVRGSGLQQSRLPQSDWQLRGCLRCLFGTDGIQDAPDCSREGILGPVVGLAGLLAAEEAMRILTGSRGRWEQNLWTFDARNARSRRQRFAPDPDCSVCGGEFHQHPSSSLLMPEQRPDYDEDETTET